MGKDIINNIKQNPWKFVFFSLSIIVLICLIINSNKVGVTGDEYFDGMNGKYALNYYTDGDTTFVDYSQTEELKTLSLLKYYGVGYEIIPAIFLKYFHLSPANEYPFRHLLCALYGFLFFLFTALTAKRLSDWRGGTIALLLITLTPVVFGLSFFATKDIPFAAGFAIANYAFISIFQHLPKFRIIDIILAIIGIAMAVSVRIGGMLLALYLVVLFALYLIFNKPTRKLIFENQNKLVWKSLGIGTGIVFFGCLLGLSFYPNFFYEGPFNHIHNALTLVSKFPQRIPMLWEGKPIDSLNLPNNYLIKSFSYTIPLFIFAGLLLFFVNVVRVWKKYDRAATLYLLFTILLPIFMILKSKSNVYNGWRHETFIYSGIIIIASIGLLETWNWFAEKKWGKWWNIAFPIILAGVLSPTAIWMFRNNKYCYAYYNSLVASPYLNFDLDYYETAQTVCLDWILKNELANNHDKVLIGCKNFNAVNYYESLGLSQDSVFQASYKGFAETDCDYSILSIQFLTKKYIKKFFPPKGTIHVEYLDGNPICAVVKRNKLDSKGIKLIREGKFAEGMQLLDSAYQFDPNNFGIWFWMGYGYYQIGQYEESVKFMDKALEFDQDQDRMKMGNEYKGLSLSALKRYGEAAAALKIAESLCKDDNELAFLKANIGLAYYNNKEYANAVTYLQQIIGKYPQLNGALQESMSKKNSQPEARPSNTSDSSSNKSTSDLFKLK